MECPICGTSNPAGTESCTQCGYSLALSESPWSGVSEGTNRPAGMAKSPPAPSPRADPVPPVQPVTPPAEEPLPRRAGALLRALQPDQPEEVRLKAVGLLGDLQTSSPQIVQALITAAQNDPAIGVRFRAIQSLRARPHLKILQAHPELRGAADATAVELVDPEGQMFPRAFKPGERRKRRKPVALVWNLAAIVIALCGLVFSIRFIPTVSQGASWWMAWLVAAAALFFLLRFLFELIWPKSSSNLFRSSQETATAEVVDKRVKVSRDQDDTTSRSYFLTVQFDAAGRPMVLEARVGRRIYHQADKGSGMGVRYATENPQVALLEGE